MSDETKVEKSTNADGKSVSQPIAKPFVGSSIFNVSKLVNFFVNFRLIEMRKYKQNHNGLEIEFTEVYFINNLFLVFFKKESLRLL